MHKPHGLKVLKQKSHQNEMVLLPQIKACFSRPFSEGKKNRLSQHPCQGQINVNFQSKNDGGFVFCSFEGPEGQ